VGVRHRQRFAIDWVNIVTVAAVAGVATAVPLPRRRQTGYYSTHIYRTDALLARDADAIMVLYIRRRCSTKAHIFTAVP